MALHDVDYLGEMRENAMPAVHDTASERKADGTTSWSQKVNSTSKARLETKDTRIVGYDSNNTAVIFIGIVPEFGDQPVIAIAKQGFDVISALGI